MRWGQKLIYLIGQVFAPITLKAALLTYHDTSATNNLRTGGTNSYQPNKLPQDSEGKVPGLFNLVFILGY